MIAALVVPLVLLLLPPGASFNGAKFVSFRSTPAQARALAERRLLSLVEPVVQ